MTFDVGDDLLATLLVLTSAVMHATWNALFKDATDRRAGLVALGLVGSLVFLPATALVPLPDARLWAVVFGSVVVHVAYQLALMRMFAKGDYVVVYPIARGSGPVVVTLVSIAFLDAPLDAMDVVSIGLIATGAVLASGLRLAAGQAASRTAVSAALVTGLAIGGYTLIDGHGMKSAVDPWTFVVWSHAAFAPVLLVLGLRAGGRASLTAFSARAGRLVAMAGFAYGGYALALFAMRLGVVAEVAALRETSILFAMVLGVAFLGEPLGRERRIGAVAIALGAVALKAF